MYRQNPEFHLRTIGIDKEPEIKSTHLDTICEEQKEQLHRKTNDEISAMDQSDTRKLIAEKPKIIKRAVQSINTIIDEII